MTEREAWQRVIWAWQTGRRSEARELAQVAARMTADRLREQDATNARQAGCAGQCAANGLNMR